MLDLDPLLLRSFIAVARAGTISAAAQQVGRTQSAVSMQMRRLEAVVGQPILYRTGAGVALTAAGDRLLRHAERILVAQDEALADVAGKGLRGTIGFGCPEDYLTAFFPAILRSFGADHGGVEIEVVCAPTIELRPLLQRRRIDLALVSLPEDAEPRRIIRPEKLVWVADRPRPEILASRILPLALSAPGTIDHDAARKAMDRAGRAYRIAFASSSLAGLLAVTRSGQAISVVTRSAVPADLHVLDGPLPPLPAIGISLAYAAARPPLIVGTFGGFVARYLAGTATAGGRQAASAR
ncbi:LysR family transcriptional regulator [Allostella sp. ATCC 35155]|nr:LysR family transcriptional regulator [Stella sp. ATCC 35155]